MSQSCFTSEVYALYAIGSLDGKELSELEMHTGRGCRVCRAELEQARSFWSTYAAAVPPVTPPPGLKQKVLEAVAPPRLQVVPKRSAPWWIQAVAAGLILSAGIGVGWKIHRPPAPVISSAPEAAVIQPTPAADEIASLQAKIDQLNAKVADREKQLQTLQAMAAKAPASTPAPPSPNAELEKTVAALQTESAQRAQLLQEARAQATQLGSEVQRLRDLAKEADDRYRTASNQRNDLATRIRTLESENAKFQRVIADQQRRIEQNTQLVSFFSSPNLRFYQYKGTKNDPAASAHAVLQEGSRALFYAFHLPQLAAGRTYQLWLIRGQGPAVVSGGLFRVDSQGNAVVEFTNPALTRDVRQFAVTDEPASGSAGPTGNQFFRAS